MQTVRNVVWMFNPSRRLIIVTVVLNRRRLPVRFPVVSLMKKRQTVSGSKSATKLVTLVICKVNTVDAVFEWDTYCQMNVGSRCGGYECVSCWKDLKAYLFFLIHNVMLIEYIHSGSCDETVTAIKADARGYILHPSLLIIRIEVPMSS